MAYGLKFHTTPFQISESDAIHRQKMLESLTYRLSIARAIQDTQLIEVLELERRQLEVEVRGPEPLQLLRSCFKAVKQGVSRFLEDGSKPQVHEFCCGSDRWLYTFDPITKEFRYADSEVELEQ